MNVKALVDPLPCDYRSEVINVELKVPILRVTVFFDNYRSGSNKGYNMDVIFNAPVGLRVLEESDLLDFWPTCSMDNGWLYQIMDKGWLAEEASKSYFTGSYDSDLKEYFIVGVDYSVSIFSWEPPKVLASVG